ncbi:MAG: glucans biosynthesis glucosyltransferase MdoH [Candidatus Nitrosoglobus sp.]|jgi:membrane glycosyltransferase
MKNINNEIMNSFATECSPLTTKIINRKAVKWHRAAWIRRTLLIVIVLAQTLVGSYYMTAILPYHGGNLVEQGLIVLFTLLFTWISVGFWIGCFGFIIRRFGGDRLSLARRYPSQALENVSMARTAVVMPIYHEPINRTLGGLRTIYLSLKDSGQLPYFDFFILSDSRNPEYWLAEQSAWYQLCRELGGFGRLFYRRRVLNMNYKSGNIADFLRRWGRNYKYTIVLDADSLMGAKTLVRMVHLMELEPQIGILQTNPTIINGKSAFARVQQFANHVYGPLFSTGLAAFQLGEAAYWGHNAIIRTMPFIRHCGLKKLPGKGLFAGPISSHDFVEAAYMGRAGYEVWLEPEIGETFEESPPTLIDELARDKRWAKGNLQHLQLLLFSPKLRFAHRMAFLNGIMSYVASPLWLAFLALSTIETTRLILEPINYFPDAHRLFPLWPEWHPEWAIDLASSTIMLLFLPKLLAIIDVALSQRRKSYGGMFYLICSTLLEILISTLLAPIRMLAHSRYVVEALFNVTLRWAGQNRSNAIGWADALVNHAPGTLIAVAWAGFAWWLDPMFFYWSLPVALPLILAAPTSVLSSRPSVGQFFRRWGFFLTPEEINGNKLLQTLEEKNILPPKETSRSAFIEAILDPTLNKVHGAFSCLRPSGAKLKLICSLRDRCLREGPRKLNHKEISLLTRHQETLHWLHHAAWQAAPHSAWGRELERRRQLK